MSLFLSPLMCSCKGLLPQSSPSHLIHKEMTGITIPQQKMLWGSQCITSFFTFAPRSNSFTLDSKILKMNQGISAPGLAPLLTCFDLDKLFSLSLRFLIYKMDNSYLVPFISKIVISLPRLVTMLPAGCFIDWKGHENSIAVTSLA